MSLQGYTLQYWVKKTRRLFINEDDAINDTCITNAVAKAITAPPIITSQVYDNHGKSQLIIIMA